jgi:hypothetical protein
MRCVAYLRRAKPSANSTAAARRAPRFMAGAAGVPPPLCGRADGCALLAVVLVVPVVPVVLTCVTFPLAIVGPGACWHAAAFGLIWHPYDGFPAPRVCAETGDPIAPSVRRPARTNGAANFVIFIRVPLPGSL